MPSMKIEPIKNDLNIMLARAKQLDDVIDSYRPSPYIEVVDSISGKLVEGAVRAYGLEGIIAPRSARSATRKGLQARRKVERTRWMKQKSAELDQLIKETSGILKFVSIDAPNLTIAGNSHLLLKRLSKVRNFKTAKGKASNLILLLEEVRRSELIANEYLPLFLAEKAIHVDEANKIITNLERAMRKTIRDAFSGTPDWWNACIPERIKKNAESRKSKVEGQHPLISEPEDNLSYVNFSEYDDIILSNWASFSSIFKDEEWTSIKLKELEPLRNTLMHSRSLTEHGFAKLRVNAVELLGRMK